MICCYFLSCDSYLRFEHFLIACPFGEVFLEKQNTREHQQEGDEKNRIGQHDEMTVKDNNGQIMTAQDNQAVPTEKLEHTCVLDFGEKNGKSKNKRESTNIYEKDVLQIIR